jgi:hypothetical protein
MAPRFLTILTGRNLPKIRQAREPEPSTINEQTIADFAREVEQTEISKWATDRPSAVEEVPRPTSLRGFTPAGFGAMIDYVPAHHP